MTDESLGIALRTTARLALVLFLLAFSASPLVRWIPSGPSRWLRRNRRRFGIAFAITHLVHGVFIAMRFFLFPEDFWEGRPLSRTLVGMVGYAFVIAMLVTSFPATARAIGPAAWRRLHGVGVYVIAFLFAAAYSRRIAEPVGMLALAGLSLAFLARLANGLARRGG